MKKIAVLRPQQREKVNAYFQSESSFWKNIYASDGVYAEIHRDRHAAVLDWIDSLNLAPGSRVLEIGCGAGGLAVALARRGLAVHAIDSVEAMVEQARQHALESGTAELLSLELGDAHALAFEDGSFDLVLAIGVIPWLEQPELAIREMARVTKSGGNILLTADNRARLHYLLDPWLNPALTPLKQRVKNGLVRVGLHRESLNDIGATAHNRRFIDEALARVELMKTRSMTLGFGPFSLFRRKVFPETFGIALHHWLQRLAEQSLPIVRSTGAHYIVLARKSSSRLFAPLTSAEQPTSDATRVR